MTPSIRLLDEHVENLTNVGLFLLSAFNSLIRIKYLLVAHSSNVCIEYDASYMIDCVASKAKKVVENNPYHPTWFSVVCDYHGQLQTISQFVWRTILSKLLPLTRLRELLHLNDGGLIALDWMGLRELHKVPLTTSISTDKIVVISHGLCGSAKSDYIAHISDILLRGGFRVVVVIRRGCAGLHIPQPSALFQHRNCLKTDLGHSIDHIVKNNPNCSIYGLGYSMGAAHWLKELGNIDLSIASHVKAAVAVCPPWNMSKQTSVFHLWSPLLAFGLKYHLSKHIPCLNMLGVDFNEVRRARTVEQLDAQLTSLYGYNSIEEYKQADSPVNSVGGIFVPTLAITADDDPVCCASGRPTSGMGKGLVLLRTTHGGHLAFPASSRNHKLSSCLSVGSYLQCTWTDGVIFDWFDSH